MPHMAFQRDFTTHCVKGMPGQGCPRVSRQARQHPQRTERWRGRSTFRPASTLPAPTLRATWTPFFPLQWVARDARQRQHLSLNAAIIPQKRGLSQTVRRVHGLGEEHSNQETALGEKDGCLFRRQFASFFPESKGQVSPTGQGPDEKDVFSGRL